jgi:predicted permease
VYTVQVIDELVIRIGLFYVFILLGYLTARVVTWKKRLNTTASNLLLYILLPILIIGTLLSAPPESLLELPSIAVFVVFIHLTGFGLMWVRLHRSEFSPELKGSVLLTVTFNNGIFLPVPLVLMFIGDVGIPIIAMYSIIQMLILGTLGTAIGSGYSSAKSDTRGMVKKVVTFPPLITVIIGVVLLVLGASVPVELDPLVTVSGIITTYLSLFVVGLGLGVGQSINRSRLVLEAIGVRQLVVPVATGLLLLMSGLSVVTRNVILLQAMMPPAVITAIFAAGFKLDSESASSIVTLGTILLLPVVPLMFLLFGTP